MWILSDQESTAEDNSTLKREVLSIKLTVCCACSFKKAKQMRVEMVEEESNHYSSQVGLRDIDMLMLQLPDIGWLYVYLSYHLLCYIYILSSLCAM